MGIKSSIPLSNWQISFSPKEIRLTGKNALGLEKVHNIAKLRFAEIGSEVPIPAVHEVKREDLLELGRKVWGDTFEADFVTSTEQETAAHTLLTLIGKGRVANLDRSRFKEAMAKKQEKPDVQIEDWEVAVGGKEKRFLEEIQKEVNFDYLIEQKRAPKEELELLRSRAAHSLRTKSPAEVQKSLLASVQGLIQTTQRAREIGNKSANLERLQEISQGDFEVPLPQPLTHEQVSAYLQIHCPEYTPLWNQFVEHVRQGGSVESGTPILNALQKAIQKTFSEAIDFPDAAMLQPFVERATALMVRSTGKEDTIKVANPGGNESVGNVQPTQLEIAQALGVVVSSYFSPKSLSQRQATGDDITQTPFMPVLLQAMVGETSPENIPVSGVMYTTEGDLTTDGVAQINATWGHAEGVVTGAKPCDMYYVHNEFVHGIVREKSTRKAPQKGDGLGDVENPKEKRNAPCLTESQAKRLAAIGHRIEEAYGYPMDVEWSYDPKQDKFYVFQARPIPQKTRPEPSYITPTTFKDLENVQQVTVIGAGGGSVVELSSENTLLASSGPEAEALFLKNLSHPPKAILLAQTTAATSHEAGFFRERGIPIIHVGENLEKIRDTLKTQTLLLDTQESIIAALPKGKSSESFISQGLRRHLAPKMETCLLADVPPNIEALETELVTLSHKVDRQALWQTLNSDQVFGWNTLDRLLNAFEMAESSEKRAFFLTCLLTLSGERLLPKIPEPQRSELKNKILYDAQHVWTVFQDPHADIQEKKFAMNFLRAALLERPADEVINADTLSLALGEVKERKILGIEDKTPPDDRMLFRDILLRTQKFVLSPEDRSHWVSFVDNLSGEGLQMLGTLVGRLGKSVAETWVNTAFVEAWASAKGRSKREVSNRCLAALLRQAGQPEVQQALALAKRSEEMAHRFQQIEGSFGDPAKFDELLHRLETELLPEAVKCTQIMGQSKGFATAIVSRSFLSLVAAYDGCIKGLTSSALYQDNTRLKAERFARILEGYLTLAKAAMDESLFEGDPSVQAQAQALCEFLPSVLNELKMQAFQIPSQLLQPSEDFSVAMTALGSGLKDPERAPPTSLEDFFTTLHQSMITAALTVGRPAGIPLKALPQDLQTVCSDIMTQLNLRREGREGVNAPTIQFIEYHYPTIKISFNCPLNVHSGQFTIVAQVNAKGVLQTVDFEGNFSCPISGIGLVGRKEALTLYALNTYQGAPAMEAPPDLPMKPTPTGMVQFHWRLFSPSTGLKTDQCQMGLHSLQQMIDYLQFPKVQSNPLQLSQDKLILAIKEHPWAISCIMGSDWAKLSEIEKTEIRAAFVNTILDNPNEENLFIFFKNFYSLSEGMPSDPVFAKILDKLFAMESFWKNSALLEQSQTFLKLMNPAYFQKHPPLRPRDKEKINDIRPMTEEQRNKIASIIPLLPKLPAESMDSDDWEKRAERKEFFELYGSG